MGYAITPNRFAPKCSDLGGREDVINSHSIAYDKCNFRCLYCELRHRPKNDFLSFSTSEFRRIIMELFQYGNSFKFTGGEPTLNPNIIRDLTIVKELGGFIYLDTNGSLPSVISNLLNDELINVLGVSIKGLNVQESINTSGISNTKLVWDNVWETIHNACSYRKVKTILTYVVNKGTANYESLLVLSKLMQKYDNLYMKINNIMENNESKKNGLFAVEQSLLFKTLTMFVDCHPEWKGRCILINSDKAVGSFKDIVFL